MEVYINPMIGAGALALIAGVNIEEFAREMFTAGSNLKGKTTFSKRLSIQLMTNGLKPFPDRKSTRLNSSHSGESRMPSSA